MTEVSTDQIKALQQVAEEHLHAGRSQEAIDELDRASEDLSTFPDLFRLKGIARLVQGNSTEARLIFDQLEGCFGDNPEFLNVYGVALRRERDLGKSKEIYQRGLDLKPNEPSLLSNYGNLLIDLGKLDEAKIVLSKALDIAPNYTDARQNMARLERSQVETLDSNLNELKENSDIDEIKDIFTDDRDELAASDWLNLAASAQRDKNLEEALLFTRKALDAQPDLAAAYKLAGEVLIKLRRPQEAERLLLIGTLIGEADADSLSNLGGLFAGQAHAKLAAVLLKRVMKMQPEHQAAKSNYENLSKQIKSGKYKPAPLI